MDTYTINLTGLLGLCGALFAAQRMIPSRTSSNDTAKDNGKAASVKDSKVADDAEAVHWPFLGVYCLVMGADWLQVHISCAETLNAGPHKH